jgi:uncharacterized CHY-type Zn-finger protein
VRRTIEVRGVGVDTLTRCAHYNSPLDVLAIKMKCCGEYFACKDCHDALAGHPLEPWPSERRDELALLCGRCGAGLTIARYLESATQCSFCKARFNPHCSDHHRYYFEDT